LEEEGIAEEGFNPSLANATAGARAKRSGIRRNTGRPPYAIRMASRHVREVLRDHIE
jgi:hypothetical protein